MPTRRIAVTGSAEYQALGAGGTLAVDHWDALTAQIGAELSPAHAALFAEPQRDAARGEIDWYAEGSGTAARADTLPEAEREALLARWHAMREEIRALAGRIGSRPDASSRFMATLIQAALTLPAPEARNLWRIDGRPVLVAWGHERAGVAAAAETLTGRMAAADVPMQILPPPAPPVPPGPRLWPLVAALAGALALLLLALLFAWRDPFGLLRPQESACVASPEDLAALAGLREASEREGALRRELARLVTDAAARRATCAPVPAPTPVAPPATAPEPPRNADLERAAREGGQTGQLQIVLAWEGNPTSTCMSPARMAPGCSGGAADLRRRTGCGRQCRAADVLPGRECPLGDAGLRHLPGRGDDYAPRGQNAVPFRVTIRQAGREDRVVTGIGRAGADRQPVTTVEVP
ncbi:hypothetical protein ACFQU2_39010 [Siccirubricoccus deserti]